MRYLFIAFLFISSFISGQGIEPTSFQPTPYKSGVLKGVIPFVDEFTGDTMYIYQHVDSLVFIKDSIFVRNDSIFLRDGTGFAIVTDSIYLVEGISKDTIKLRDGKGYTLISKGGVTNVTATTPLFSSGGTTPNITIQNASTSTTGALTSTDWNTFNNKMYDFGYVTQSGTGAGVISYLTNHQYINFINGSNITISRASGTNNVTISAASSGGTVTSVSSSAGDGISTSVTNSTTTPNISIINTKPFDLIYTQANSGSYGGLYNGNVLNLTGSGGTTVSRSGNTFTISSTTASSNLSFDTESGGYTYLNNTGGSSVYFQEGTGINLVRSASNVLTVNSTVTNTDNQTLSFSSPNLSISGGNSVALPVLPAGSSSNTLRHNGSAWVASSLLANGGTRIDINSWPGTINLGSRLLVNGYIQYNPTGFQATTLAGRDTDGGLTGVTVGSGLSLSSGTVNATDASTTNELQTLSNTGTASDHTVTLSNGGGSLKIAMGTGIDVVSSGTASNGVVTINSTVTGTVTSIATNNGITGGTITTSGTVGLTGQALALHNLGTNGMISRTGSGTVAARTITSGSAADLTITNGDGVSGNPTISQYKEYAYAYSSGGQSITTSLSYIDLTGQGPVQNMTVSTAGNTISSGGSGSVWEHQCHGYIYNPSSTPVDVQIFFYRNNGGVSYDQLLITAREGNTPFAMQGITDGSGTFNWRVYASASGTFINSFAGSIIKL